MTRCLSEYYFGYRAIKCLRGAGHVGDHSGRCGGPLTWTDDNASQSKSRAMADFLSR